MRSKALSRRVRKSRCALAFLGLLAACETAATSAGESDGGFTRSASSASEDRYHDNQNGTVADADTWLLWQQTPDTGEYTWEQAQNYCKWLDLQGRGWRLPTLKELSSTADKRFNPTLDPSAFPSPPALPFWSATPVDGLSTFVWQVDFGTGEAQAVAPDSKLHVRCVRGTERVER